MYLKISLTFGGIIILLSFFVSTNLLVSSNGANLYKTIFIKIKGVDGQLKNITYHEQQYYFDKYNVYIFHDYFLNISNSQSDQIASSPHKFHNNDIHINRNRNHNNNYDDEYNNDNDILLKLDSILPSSTNNNNFNKRDNIDQYYDTTINNYLNGSPLKKFFAILNYLNKVCLVIRFIPLFIFIKRCNFMIYFNFTSESDKKRRNYINLSLLISYSILNILMYIMFFLMMDIPKIFREQNQYYHNISQSQNKPYYDFLCDGFGKDQYYFKCLKYEGSSKIINNLNNELYIIKWYPDSFWIFSIIASVLDSLGFLTSIYYYFTNEVNYSIDNNNNSNVEMKQIKSVIKDINIQIKDESYLEPSFDDNGDNNSNNNNNNNINS